MKLVKAPDVRKMFSKKREHPYETWYKSVLRRMGVKLAALDKKQINVSAFWLTEEDYSTLKKAVESHFIKKHRMYPGIVKRQAPYYHLNYSPANFGPKATKLKPGYVLVRKDFLVKKESA